jgi:predicted CXXCH cytochrome family protein
MKRIVLHLVILSGVTTLLLPSAVNAAAAAHLIKVLSPPDKAVVEGKQLNLVFQIKRDSLDTVRVTFNKESPRLIQSFAGSVCHERLAPEAGKNRLKIEGVKGGKIVEEINLIVFRRSAFSSQFSSAPSGFSAYFFHTDRNERSCISCHQKELRAGSPPFPNQGSPACLFCHGKITSSQFVHGPTAVGGCTLCHSQHIGNRKNGVSKPEGEACRACHTEIAQGKAHAYGHSAAFADKCTLCHNPHAENNPNLLRHFKGSVKEFCRNCHKHS